MKTKHNTRSCGLFLSCNPSTPLLWLSIAAILSPALLYSQTLTGSALHIGSNSQVTSNYTVAVGNNNKARGWCAVTIGELNDNDPGAYYSVLVGLNNYQAPGSGKSVIVGSNNYFQATNSMAVGNSNAMRGDSNFVTGNTNTFSADATGGVPVGSSMLGTYNTLKGGYSNIISGNVCVADSANYSATLGYGLINLFDNALVVGKYNQETGFSAANPPLFVVGNGTNNTTGRSNAFVVHANGDISVKKTIRVNPSGDISMGPFTAGPKP